jgi:hypothetical protein
LQLQRERPVEFDGTTFPGRKGDGKSLIDS